eukprot:c6048_g1_i2 orf=62-250(+)
MRRRFHRLVSEFLLQTASTVLTRINFHDYTIRPTIADLDFGSSESPSTQFPYGPFGGRSSVE